MIERNKKRFLFSPSLITTSSTSTTVSFISIGQLLIGWNMAEEGGQTPLLTQLSTNGGPFRPLTCLPHWLVIAWIYLGIKMRYKGSLCLSFSVCLCAVPLLCLSVLVLQRHSSHIAFVSSWVKKKQASSLERPFTQHCKLECRADMNEQIAMTIKLLKTETDPK